MTIPTPEGLCRQNRRLDRRLGNVEMTLAVLRGRAAPHLQYLDGKLDWWLTNGQRVDSDVAAEVIADERVVPVGTALFDGLLGQGFRFAPPPK